MSSEEAGYVSPMEGTPKSGKGTLDTWRFSSSARRPDTEPAINRRRRRSEAVGKPRTPGRM
jgi:hypothetical protein